MFLNAFQSTSFTMGIVAQNAAILGAYTYIPFGQFMDAAPGSGSSSLSYYYTAQEWDNDKGIYNYNARMYDPSLKRFYSTDSAGEGASPYAYCMNNPIMFTDPSGNVAGEDWFGYIASATLFAIGVGASLVTVGAATPVAIAGALVGSAFVGAGTSGAFYTLSTEITGDNWTFGAWAGSATFGAVGGVLSAGISGVAGYGISAATRGITSFATRASVTVGASVAAGALTDVAVNSLGNLAMGNDLSSGIYLSAIGGGIGGLFGGIAGVRKRVSQKYRIDPDSLRNLKRSVNGNKRGLTGILAVDSTKGSENRKNIEKGTIFWKDFEVGRGTAHQKMAASIEGLNIDEDHSHFHPAWAQGMSINFDPVDRYSFQSRSLNLFEKNPKHGTLKGWMAPGFRYAILSKMRDEGFKGIVEGGRGWSKNETPTDKVVAFFLRTPV